MTGRRPRAIPDPVWLACAVFLAVLVGWSVLTPAYRAPDEPQHVSAVLGLASGVGWPRPGHALIDPAVLDSAVLGGLLTTPDQRTSRGNTLPATHKASGRSNPPLFSAVRPEPRGQRPPLSSLGAAAPTDQTNQMTQHPPLYYLLAAAVYRVSGAAGWSWDRQLALLRLVGVVLVAPLPLLAWALTRTLGGTGPVASAAAWLPLAVPQLAQVGAGVSNDSLVVLLGALTLLCLARVMTGSGAGALVALAVSLGLALLTKGTLLVLVPVVAVGVVVGRRRTGWRAVAVSVAVLAGAMVVGGWWWVVNLLRYDTLQPNGFGAVRPAAGQPLPGWAFLRRFADLLTDSFWGNFGWLEVPLPAALTLALTAAGCALAVLGLIGRPAGARLLSLSSPVLILAALAQRIHAEHARTGGFNGTQGRYLFGGLLGLLALTALGLGWLGRRARIPDGLLVGSTALGCAALSWYGAGVAFTGFYRDTGDTWAGAAHRLLAWAPWPAAVTLVLGALPPVILLLGGGLSAMRALGREPSRAGRP